MSREQASKIIKEAANGNLKAFEEIVFKYEKPIFSYMVKLTNRKEDAEDLTQETFLKLYKNINKYNNKNKFSTWLFTIATNTTYDWFRKQKRRNEVFILDDPDRKQQVEKLLLSKEWSNNSRIDLESGLSKIKPIYRSVLSLFYLKGFSYKEIAKIKKLPTNTVKTYLYRAKLAIKEHLS